MVAGSPNTNVEKAAGLSGDYSVRFPVHVDVCAVVVTTMGVLGSLARTTAYVNHWSPEVVLVDTFAADASAKDDHSVRRDTAFSIAAIC